MREHVNEKFETYKELKRKGFRPNMAILMYAIVETLPDTWPKESIYTSLNKEIKELRDLESVLENMEFDLLCVRALDQVEKTMMENPNKYK